VPLERTPEGTVTPSTDELIALAADAGFEGVDLGNTRHLDAAMMRRLTQADLRVCVWTVNDAAEAARLRDIGVAGVTTDWPARLRAELGL
jgi:glycerophosphoryl diester phosphodiesterase